MIGLYSVLEDEELQNCFDAKRASPQLRNFLWEVPFSFSTGA